MEFVSQCLTCQKVKAEHRHPEGDFKKTGRNLHILDCETAWSNKIKHLRPGWTPHLSIMNECSYCHGVEIRVQYGFSPQNGQTERTTPDYSDFRGRKFLRGVDCNT